MKISRIHLKDFHQFKDFNIDLTYPKGHEKEGKPLNKVCFIGQSGTGKTSLLELIPKYIRNYNTNVILKSGEESLTTGSTVYLSFGLNNEFSTAIEFVTPKEPTSTGWTWGNRKHVDLEMDDDEFYKFFTAEWYNKTATKLIYFPANMNFNIDEKTDNLINNKQVIDFSTENVGIVWNLILEQIQSYQEQELQIRQEISKIVEQASNDLDIIRKAIQKLEDWKKTEFNPIQDIADKCLDKILKVFKLRVKTELDIKSKKDLGFIKLEDFLNNQIPYSLWSTGTKQVVLTAVPLYLLKPMNTIILFDEPERSLYPDLQRFIIDFYSSLTQNCQFFYSTHSPIIASSFEPWEIVELKFNKEGYVYRELYYEGENHVDNYKYNPRYMRWDDILQRIFDMENDGSALRKEKLDELAKYNVKYKKLMKQKKEESVEGENILNNIQRLSKELSTWES